jgi:hypothetical protein
MPSGKLPFTITDGEVKKIVAEGKQVAHVKATYADLKTHCAAIIANTPCRCATGDHESDFLFEGREELSLREWLDFELELEAFYGVDGFYADSDDDHGDGDEPM